MIKTNSVTLIPLADDDREQFMKKGFTLMELLIVIAIIVVLIAISIPVFSASLEKSRESVDLNNLRSAYSEISQSVELGEVTSNRIKNTSNSIVTTIKCASTKDKWQTLNSTQANIGGINVSAPYKDKQYIRVKYYKSGENAGKIKFTRQNSVEGIQYNR